MATVSEKSIETKVVRYARARGVLVLKLNVMHNRSWPDRVFWIPGGRPFLIEFKRPGATPTPKQAIMLRKLEELGYDVTWCDSVESGIEELRMRGV